VAFGKTGEALLAHAKKGDKLAITGKIKTKFWERDGVKQQDLDIVIETWQFVSSKPTNNAIGNQGPASWP
jgi:single-stranded DNA-binding protein